MPGSRSFRVRVTSPPAAIFIFLVSLIAAWGAALSSPLRGANPKAESEVVLTVVLARDDEAGFQRLVTDLYNPASTRYHAFLTQDQIVERFGPSSRAYKTVLAYLRSHGFTLIERSRNHLTLVVRGSRDAASRAFGVRISDVERNGRLVHESDREPELPPQIAPHVRAVIGLSSLPEPRPAGEAIRRAVNVPNCWLQALLAGGILSKRANETDEDFKARVKACQDAKYTACLDAAEKDDGSAANNGAAGGGDPAECIQNPSALVAALARTAQRGGGMPHGIPWTEIDGSGQTIALLQFDNFRLSDVRDYLDFIGAPATQIDKLSSVAVNGGATIGPNETEVLLDIVNVMLLAPGADIVVYHAPFTGAGTSFQALLNAAIDGGATIISNSWAYCEDQTTAADVESIEAILQNAAAAGISVFSASGDSGSTCLNGAPDTIAVPASAPSLTAVGGSSLRVGPAGTYGSETWWDGTNDTPRTGAGGFGTSGFFTRPAYQDGATGSVMRSIPDVVANADPAQGILLCQASAGGCPTGLIYGGTSRAAPTWAAFTALLNQAQGEDLGFLNPLIYPLAGTDAFHDAASMGSDFAHVGLGSPNLNVLHRMLAGEATTAVSATLSQVVTDGALVPPLGGVPNDGNTAVTIVARLRDTNGNSVSGKTVALEASPAGNVVITPVSAVTSIANGAAVFEATNLVAETVTFTATDVTDGVVLAQSVRVDFVAAVAASAGISAFPTEVAADGVSETTITVTLQDSLGRPASGKLVRLSQGGGHSVVMGPMPSVTDAEGKIVFTATNLVTETVTYAAVDVTDGELEVPGSADVTFSGGSPSACGAEAPPAGTNGYVVTPFATGFEAGPFFFGGVNFNGCPGAALPAFRGDDVFISNVRTGDLFRFGTSGGAASTVIASHGPTLAAETVAADDRLYALRVATTGNFTTGVILELDPDTGDVVRTVASNLRCPHSLVVDPLSGDLFYDDFCTGAGSDDPAIYRVRDPASASPAREVYVTLPRTPNGRMVFAPDGTLFAVTGYTDPQPAVVRISGTDAPMPPSVEAIDGVHSIFWVNVAEVDAAGAARSLLLLDEEGLKVVDLTADPPAGTLVAENIGGGVIGPDGCLYASRGHTVFRVTETSGACGFQTGAVAPTLVLSPAAVSPDPAQGTEQAFAATLRNAVATEGTAIRFFVNGANRRLVLARTDASGMATFRYTGAMVGRDIVTASAVVGAGEIVSNAVEIDWAPGQHVTFLSLNESPTVATTRRLLAAIASLTDESLDPPAPVEGAIVSFSLDGDQCQATTDTEGVASCELSAASPGMAVLSATFPGNAEFVASSQQIAVNILCGDCGDPTGDRDTTASDALVALRTSVGNDTCHLCLCDVNSSGSVTVTDALAMLRRAVGQPDVLSCPQP